MNDPSWSEIHQFTKFFDVQLDSCEASTFLDMSIVGDVFSGLKGFVVKFMIRMSRVRFVYNITALTSLTVTQRFFWKSVHSDYPLLRH